jgi:hypothetical protein
MSDVYKTIADTSLTPLLRKIVALKTKITTNVKLSIDEIKELYKIKEFFDRSHFTKPEQKSVNHGAHIPVQRFGTQNPAIDYSSPKPSAPPANASSGVHGQKGNLGTNVVSVGGNTKYSTYHKEVIQNPDVRSNLDDPNDIVYKQSKHWLRKLDYIRSTHENYVLVDVHDDDCDSFEIVDKVIEDQEVESIGEQSTKKPDTIGDKNEELAMREIYSGNQDNGIITLKDEIEKQAAHFKNKRIILANAQKRYYSPLANPIDINPMIHAYV